MLPALTVPEMSNEMYVTTKLAAAQSVADTMNSPKALLVVTSILQVTTTFACLVQRHLGPRCRREIAMSLAGATRSVNHLSCHIQETDPIRKDTIPE